MKNTDYIASGEYEGEFYLIEKSSATGLFNISRHSDGKAFTRSYKGDGYKGLTDFRQAIKKHGEEKVIGIYARLGKYAKLVPMYKAGILRDSHSARPYI